MRRLFLAVALAVLLAGCKALPDKPLAQTLYDFGPPEPAVPVAAPARPALMLPDVEATGQLVLTSVLYRLGYQDPHHLRTYAYASWSAQPGELVRQRLREVLGRERPVLDTAGAAGLTRLRGGMAPAVLRVELDEFSQFFRTPASSEGVVRLRCTLLEHSGSGARLVAQRTFEVRRPAPTADAPGGVRALAAATDAAAQDIAAWVRGATLDNGGAH